MNANGTPQTIRSAPVSSTVIFQEAMDIISYGHYTSLSGLMGIVKDEIIWATNIKFLNDEHEFQHALDLIKDIISRSKITSDHRNYSLHKEYVNHITERLDSLDANQSDSIFTFSFSEETDLLSQWRGYCPANNGYCIVFDARKLQESIKEIFNDCHLVKCVYDLEHKEAQLKKLLNDYWTKYIEANDKKKKKLVVDYLTKEIMLLASYFKHPSFAEEKEHRIVILLEYAPDNDLKFREGRFSLIPYIELPAPRRAINEFYIGPTAHKHLANRALQAFLEKCYGVPIVFIDMGIEYSKTPYRSW